MNISAILVKYGDPISVGMLYAGGALGAVALVILIGVIIKSIAMYRAGIYPVHPGKFAIKAMASFCVPEFLGLTAYVSGIVGLYSLYQLEKRQNRKEEEMLKNRKLLPFNYYTDSKL